MIAMPGMLSTSLLAPLLRRRAALLAAAGSLLSGCVAEYAPPGPAMRVADVETDAFVMPDGMRLPYRAWLPVQGWAVQGRAVQGRAVQGWDGVAPWAVVLALHGFNDSRDAWEIPAPALAASGIAVYAPDQRGFGATMVRGRWPGADALADDAAAMARLLRRRHPRAKLVLAGESMGGAVLMHLATRGGGPHLAGDGGALPVDGYMLLAPAVWGRASMNVFMQGGLWLVATLLPGLTVSRPPPGVRIIASDNNDALRRLSRNPLTVRATRFDTLRGLVDLMDLALAAAPRFPQVPALFLYGANDMIIPAAATRAIWSALPGGVVRRSFYQQGYHLLPRDLGRAVPIADIVAWIRNPAAPLPSGGEAAAARWVAGSPAV